MKRVISPEGSLDWVEHRFITEGFLRDLSSTEILLYLFLTAVSDRDGLSFYHDERISCLLKIDLASLGKAREALVRRSLLAYEFPIYQVLSLPPEPLILPSREERERREQEIAHYYLKKIREILQ
ncbi:MAG: hypothetical protein ACPLF9_08545 [Methanothermobacter tenebrarum]